MQRWAGSSCSHSSGVSVTARSGCPRAANTTILARAPNGARHLDTYLAKCGSLLRSAGAMLLQAITIQDQYYRSPLRSVDFIQRYVFPGSFIPSVSAIANSLQRVTDLKIFHLDDIGPRYARTLALWRRNFFERLGAVRKLGYSDQCIRLWEFYLCYGEGGLLKVRADQPRLLESLRTAVGPDVLIDAPAGTAPFLTDQRRLYQGRALAVALPRSVDEVSKLLAWCDRHGIGVVPQGGNTSYCGGATPDASGMQLVIGLRRLNRIRQIDAANFSMTVEAGCLLANVQQAALDADRFFPLELGSAGSCQIGGNLATNAGGLNVLRFGMMRDLVLGIEAVLPDGRVFQRLRTLRKDNTGYDLRGLLIGSEGTLAIITAATLKLWPQPRSTATAFVAVPTVAAAVELLGRLRSAAGERINSYELLPRSGIELAVRHVEGVSDPLGAAHDWYVLCELSSFAPEPLDGLLAETLAAATAAGLVIDAVLSGNERQRASFWRLREDIPEAQRRAGPSIKHDVSVPVARLPEFVEQASAWIRREVPAGTLVAYGHAGDGNLHFNISFLTGAAPATLSGQELVIRRAIHDLVAAYGGSFSAEHGIGQLKVGELQRYATPVELAMMRAIKQALDPKGIMNPGKVLPRT